MAPLRVRCSTTYTAMMKIIAIITTVGPLQSQPTVVTDPEEQRSNCKRGLDIDLNLRLGPWPDDGIGSVDGGGGGATGCSGIVDAPAESSVMSSSEKKPPSAVGSISVEGLTADKSSQGECDPEGRTKMKKAEEVGREYSEITNIPAEEETEGGKRRSEGYLDVLVEAVRQVSGFFSDEEEEEEKTLAGAEESRKKKGSDLEEEEELCGPVVRSKRGRNQALPSRYRDSVLEPWGKLPTVTRCSKAARR